MSNRGTSNSIRCFVAMALGREDSDRVYDRMIAPELRKNGITPIRIDRVEHNDNIDDRIIMELHRCDFALADLSYARPSVYYEAGFAERQIPVIYTCRRDHLSGRVNDPFGNFRVHFDLQMRNIISWSKPLDQSFAQRLGRRIKKVIRPLVLLKKAQAEQNEEAKKFNMLSVRDRLKLILSAGIARSRRTGYRAYTEIRSDSEWVGTRSQRGSFTALFFSVTSSLHKAEFLDRLNYWQFLIGRMVGKKTHGRPGSLPQVTAHIFLCSLQQIPARKIMSYAPDFHLSGSANTFAGERITHVRQGFAGVRIYIHVFDGIKSGKEFGVDLTGKFKTLVL